MHLNKLSTAALMRLTILASLDLIMGRVVDSWYTVLHPFFFLVVVTLNLGLYAVMVYSGTLNKALIAMMLTGLAGVVAILIVGGGLGAPLFMSGGPFRRLGLGMQEAINHLLARLPTSMHAGGPLRLWGQTLDLLAHGMIDLAGLTAIISAGRLARALQGRETRGGPPEAPRPS